MGNLLTAGLGGSDDLACGARPGHVFHRDSDWAGSIRSGPGVPSQLAHRHPRPRRNGEGAEEEGLGRMGRNQPGRAWRIWASPFLKGRLTSQV
ncbi:hypothetical protein ACOMHN_044729 [Nucella lapillus]